MSSDIAVRFLVVATDASLEEEFDIALEGLKGIRCVTDYVADPMAGVEAARLRQPDFVLIEMGSKVAEIRAFAEEVGAVAPEAAVVAVYRRQAFADPELESNLIIEALRARVSDFLRRPISTGELLAIVERMGDRDRAPRGAAMGKVISFVSNKGGVGKSAVSANVACELARRHPGEVVLLDLSLQLGVCASMLDIDANQSIADAAEQLDRLDTTLLQQLAIPHSSGLRVLPAPPTVLRASQVDERVVSRVISLARRVYKYVVVDTFPVVDGVVMSVLDLSNTVCVVTQVIVPVLNGTASLLETLAQLGLDSERIWVVLNHSQPSFAGELKVADVEAHLQTRVRHEVSYDRRVPMSVNMGRPHVLHAWRFSGFRRSIRKIVDDIEASSGTAPVEVRPEESEESPRLLRLEDEMPRVVAEEA